VCSPAFTDRASPIWKRWEGTAVLVREGGGADDPGTVGIIAVADRAAAERKDAIDLLRARRGEHRCDDRDSHGTAKADIAAEAGDRRSTRGA